MIPAPPTDLSGLNPPIMPRFRQIVGGWFASGPVQTPPPFQWIEALICLLNSTWELLLALSKNVRVSWHTVTTASGGGGVGNKALWPSSQVVVMNLPPSTVAGFPLPHDSKPKWPLSPSLWCHVCVCVSAEQREDLKEFLFEGMHFHSVYLVDAAVAALGAQNIVTGIVVNAGPSLVCLSAVVGGVLALDRTVVLPATSAQALAPAAPAPAPAPAPDTTIAPMQIDDDDNAHDAGAAAEEAQGPGTAPCADAPADDAHAASDTAADPVPQAPGPEGEGLASHIWALAHSLSVGQACALGSEAGVPQCLLSHVLVHGARAEKFGPTISRELTALARSAGDWQVCVQVRPPTADAGGSDDAVGPCEPLSDVVRKQATAVNCQELLDLDRQSCDWECLKGAEALAAVLARESFEGHDDWRRTNTVRAERPRPNVAPRCVRYVF